MAGFSDITGREKIIEGLTASISNNNVGHAYILEGEKGSGRRTLAEAFAMTLQCEEGGLKPCMHCLSCRQTMSKNQPDIINVVHEKPATVSVDDIRKQVVRDMDIRPYSSRYKIYIIAEAEKMNVQAQNALLKTLEEPPEYGVILLLTNNAASFLPTIVSRCSLLRLNPLSDDIVRSYLLKELHVDEYRAGLYTALARGNIGRAKELIADEEFLFIKDEALTIAKNIGTMGMGAMSGTLKRLCEKKQSLGEFLDILTLWYRDVLVYKAEREPERLSFIEEVSAISDTAAGKTFEELARITEHIREARERLSSNVNPETTLELLFLELKKK